MKIHELPVIVSFRKNEVRALVSSFGILPSENTSFLMSAIAHAVTQLQAFTLYKSAAIHIASLSFKDVILNDLDMHDNVGGKTRDSVAEYEWDPTMYRVSAMYDSVINFSSGISKMRWASGSSQSVATINSTGLTIVTEIYDQIDSNPKTITTGRPRVTAFFIVLELV